MWTNLFLLVFFPVAMHTNMTHLYLTFSFFIEGLKLKSLGFTHINLIIFDSFDYTHKFETSMLQTIVILAVTNFLGSFQIYYKNNIRVLRCLMSTTVVWKAFWPGMGEMLCLFLSTYQNIVARTDMLFVLCI